MGHIATTIDNQIRKLEERGLVLDMPEVKIKEVLLDIGYYRLGFYWHPFELDTKESNVIHKFQDNTKFSTVLDLYYLDVDLRYLLIKFINRIEINFRTKLIYYCSNKYRDTPTWFIDPKVVSRDFIVDFDKYYDSDFKTKNKVIQRHHKKHINDKYAPAWKTLEYFTFGTNVKIYKSLLDSDIIERISKLYNVNDVDKFKNLIDTIVFVRNYCAHGNVMFDLRAPRGISKLSYYDFNNNDRHCLDSCIKVITYILSQISENRSKELTTSLEILYNEYMQKNESIKHIIETKIRYVQER